MNLKVRYVGLDVHPDSIVIAVADEGRGEAQAFQKIAHDWQALSAMLKRLAQGALLMICYEAGPTGYVMHRKMTSAGYHSTGPQSCDDSIIPAVESNRLVLGPEAGGRGRRR